MNFLRQRYYRQSDEPLNHSPQQQTSSFWNLLNTHGLGISAHLGAGIRLASSDNHGASDPSRTPRPNTNSVWDRYLGSTWHVGLNTHLGNNKQGQEGAAQHAHSGSLPIVGVIEDEKKQLINAELTTPQADTVWERLVNYLPWSRWNEQNCDSERKEECNNVSNNIFSRIFTRLFLRPRNKEELVGDIVEVGLNGQNKTTDSSKEYYQQLTLDNDGTAKQNDGWLQDFQTFANTVRQFFVERFSSYVTQGAKNEKFLRTMIRKSIFNIMNGTEPKFFNGNTKKTDNILFQTLSKYFTDERIRLTFPQVELVRMNIVRQNMSNEEEYNTWFNNHFVGWLPVTPPPAENNL
ncbi:hypothetical protein V9T40_005375 [Parthenolecanium corni]|uniref:Uncharacterized protein n=1 Tax=Parthenolecanium corni TaxID=536013 RepID=A0AAN9TVS9_9HEMI